MKVASLQVHKDHFRMGLAKYSACNVLLIYNRSFYRTDGPLPKETIYDIILCDRK
jgi:hypothetical protein